MAEGDRCEGEGAEERFVFLFLPSSSPPVSPFGDAAGCEDVWRTFSARGISAGEAAG